MITIKARMAIAAPMPAPTPADDDELASASARRITKLKATTKTHFRNSHPSSNPSHSQHCTGS
jgi:hypothetical protein